MISNVSIRLATMADAAELARLRWDFSEDALKKGVTFEAFQAQFTDFLRESLPSDQWTFWVMANEEQILATTFVKIIQKVPRPSLTGARWGYVSNVYVVPEQRNNGLGAELLRHVQSWARDQHLEYLILWPSARSVPFYLRAGFIARDSIMQWYPNGH